jgi:hypothetical protein
MRFATTASGLRDDRRRAGPTGGEIDAVQTAGKPGKRRSSESVSNYQPSTHRTGGQVNVSRNRAPPSTISVDSPNDALDSRITGHTRASSEVDLKQIIRRIGRRPVHEGQGLLLRAAKGYRLDAGINFIEGLSDAAWARAVPAIAPLRPGFKAPEAVLLPGASKDPDFDIAQLQGLQHVREDSFSVRLDYRFNNRWSMYGRGFHDQGTNNQPEGVSGRVVRITDNPSMPC